MIMLGQPFYIHVVICRNNPETCSAIGFVTEAHLKSLCENYYKLQYLLRGDICAVSYTRICPQNQYIPFMNCASTPRPLLQQESK